MRSFSLLLLALVASLLADPHTSEKSRKHAPKKSHSDVPKVRSTNAATSWIDSRAEAGCDDKFNCSSLASVHAKETVLVVAAQLVYHRNYTQAHLATSVTKLTSVYGQEEENVDDIPLVTLSGPCFTLEKEIAAATEAAPALFVSSIQFVVKSGAFLTLKAKNPVSISGVAFYGLRTGSTISSSLMTATAGSLSFNEVSFQHISVSGASLLTFSGISSFSSESSYQYITSTSSGAVASFTVSADCTVEISGEASDISSGSNGGAFAFTVQKDKKLTLNGLPEIDGCSASGKGGALYADVQGTLEVDADSELYFDGCTAKEGNIFYVTTSQTAVVDTFKQLTLMIFMEDAEEYTDRSNAVVVDFTGTNAKKYYVVDLVDPYYVLAKDEKDADCTGTGHKCATITDLVDLIARESEKDEASNLILLNKGTHEAESAQIEIAARVYIAGASSTAADTVMTLSEYEDSKACFVISSSVYFESIKFEVDTTNGWAGGFSSTGSLYFINCQFTQVSKSAALFDSLFLFSSSLHFDATTISGITLASEPLIQVNPDTHSSFSLYFDPGTVVSDIVRNDGDGAVIGAALNGYGRIDCTGTTFKNCKTKGNGGAIYLEGESVHLSLGDADDDEDSSVDATTKFEGCQAGYSATSHSNADTYGGAIYLKNVMVSIGKLTFGTNTATKGTAIYAEYSSTSDLSGYLSWETPNSADNKYVAKIEDKEYDIFKIIPVTAYVSGADSAKDENDCSKEKPCKTLAHVLTACDDIHILSLDASTHAAEEEKVTFSDSIVVKGQGADKSIKLVTDLGADKEQCYNIGYSTTSFEELTFRVVSNKDGADFSIPVFKAQNGLSLTNVHFEEVGHADSATKISPLVSYLIDFSGYMLVFSNCVFKGFVMKETALLNINKHCSFSVPQRSTFTGITRKAGSGSVLELSFESDSATRAASNGGHGDDSLTISNLDFDSCICEDGNGGAVSVTLSSEPTVVLSSLSFKNSKAARKAASAHANADAPLSMGGGLYLLLESSPDFYAFACSHLEASGCSADLGTAFYSGSTSEDLVYDGYIWEGLLSGNPGSNEFVLGVVTKESDGSYTPNKERTKQVSDVAPYSAASGGDDDDDDGLPTWVIIVIVVAAVVVIAVVVVIIIYCLKCRNASSSKVDPKDKEASPSETQQPPQEDNSPAEETQEQ